MPRFTLRDAFWCTTLIAVGAAEIGAIVRHKGGLEDTGLLSLLMLGSIALIGTASGALVGRPKAGLVVGCLVGALAAIGWLGSNLLPHLAGL